MSGYYYASALASLLVGVVLWFGSPPIWWFGAGLTFAGLATLGWAVRDTIGNLYDRLNSPRRHFGIEWRPTHLIAELGAVVFIAWVVAVMLPEAVLGDRPVSHDHTVHYFKAWQLEHEFLADGRLFGWSHNWFAGYPAQYLYPIGADLLVVGVHLATFGLVEFGTAYAWAISLFWFASGWAVYRFGVGAIGRWGALLAAFLFMTDTASNGTGGWHFAIEWGVWPMSLATVLGVWAMSRVPPMMEERRWRDVGIFGLLMGASLVTHPFMLIFLTIGLAAALPAYWIARTERHWLVGTSRLAVGAVVGGLVGTIWLLPFLTSSTFMDAGFGGYWTSIQRLGSGMYALNFLPGTWGMAIAVGLVGMVALLWSREFEQLYLGMLALVFIVFGTTDFLAGFHALEFFPALQRVQFARFMILLKPFWMLAAAYGVVAIVRHTRRRAISWHDIEAEQNAAAGQPVAKRWAHLLLIAVALAPVALPYGERFAREKVVRSLQTAPERGMRDSRDALVEWFEREHGDDPPFFRVGIDLSRNDHRLVDLGTRLPVPVYKMGYTPATSYNYRFGHDDPELLEAVNVRYVVSLGGPPAGQFEQVAQFGRLKVHEFRDWQFEPFEILEGGGEVTVERFGDEEIVLEAGEGAQGRLRLNVSNFSGWRAYRDGEPVEIEETSVVDDKHTGFMTVELAPGTYRFEFRRGWLEWLGLLLFVVGLALVVGFVAADREGRVGERLRRWPEFVEGRLEEFCERRRHQLAGVGTAGFLMVVGLGFGMAWVWPPLDSRVTTFTEDVTEVRYDFGDRLREATVRAGGQTCRNRMGRHVCGTARWQQVHQRIEDFGHANSMARCIWAHPLPAGPLEITYTGVPDGEALVGYLGVPESGSASSAHPVEFEVGIDGRVGYSKELIEASSLEGFRMRLPDDGSGGGAEGRRVTFRVSAEETGERHFCFNAQVVDLTREP